MFTAQLLVTTHGSAKGWEWVRGRWIVYNRGRLPVTNQTILTHQQDIISTRHIISTRQIDLLHYRFEILKTLETWTSLNVEM